MTSPCPSPCDAPKPRLSGRRGGVRTLVAPWPDADAGPSPRPKPGRARAGWRTSRSTPSPSARDRVRQVDAVVTDGAATGQGFDTAKTRTSTRTASNRRSVLLAGRDSGRAPRSLRQRGRPVVPDVRSDVRRSRGALLLAARQPAHRRAAHALVKKAHTSSSTSTSAHDVAAVIHTSGSTEGRRSSPATRGCCTRRSTASSAKAALADARGLDEYNRNRCCGRSPRATDPARARPAATQDQRSARPPNVATTARATLDTMRNSPSSWARFAAAARRS